jgi:hypothetical protein
MELSQRRRRSPCQFVKEGAARHRRGAGPTTRNSSISRHLQIAVRQYVASEMRNTAFSYGNVKGRDLMVDLGVDGTYLSY